MSKKNTFDRMSPADYSLTEIAEEAVDLMEEVDEDLRMMFKPKVAATNITPGKKEIKEMLVNLSEEELEILRPMYGDAVIDEVVHNKQRRVQ